MSADLDREIDRAVREMLDVEPPAGLRARVMQRIEGSSETSVASAFRRKSAWIAVAAAAAIVIAVVLTRREGPALSPAPTTLPPIVQATPTPELPTSTPATPASTPRTLTVNDRRSVAVPPREAQRIAATAAVEPAPDETFSRIPSLSIPALSVPDIQRVAPAASPTQLGVQPIAEPAPIEFEPLPLSPRERQDQE